MRALDEIKTTTSRKAYNRLHKLVACRKDGRCTFCGWHRGENLKRRHGKPKRKDHR